MSNSDRISEIFKNVNNLQIEAHTLIEKEIKRILKLKNIDEWSSLFGWTYKNNIEIDEPKEITKLTDEFEETFFCCFSAQLHFKKGRDF